MLVEHGLERLEQADLVCVPAMPRTPGLPDGVAEALQRAVARGARVLSVCSGAFTLGEAGLLDGRECTTHWGHTAELEQRFPLARVVPEVLVRRHGPGGDQCGHRGRDRRLPAPVAPGARCPGGRGGGPADGGPPQRDGGQAQFIARAVPDCDAETLGPLLTWIVEHLEEDLGVEALARRALMSPRTFARRFREETGTTPHSWVTHQRVAAAEELLERSDLAVEQIATRVGFGNAATLRQQFGRVRGISPQQYRRQFAS